MDSDEFMRLWTDKNQERTVIITDMLLDLDCPVMVVSFPLYRVAVAKIDFLEDKPF